MIQKLFLIVVGGLYVAMGGCDVPPQKPNASVMIDAKYGDKLRYPGEVQTPKDIYKKAHANAVKNISVDNMEERLADIERQVNKELTQ